MNGYSIATGSTYNFEALGNAHEAFDNTEDITAVTFTGSGLDDAIEELKLASLEPSKFVECQGVIALCYFEKGEHEQAIKAFQKARERIEDQGEKYQDLTYQIATIYEQNKDHTEAIQEFQELFKINPNYRDVKQRLKKLQR